MTCCAAAFFWAPIDQGLNGDAPKKKSWVNHLTRDLRFVACIINDKMSEQGQYRWWFLGSSVIGYFIWLGTLYRICLCAEFFIFLWFMMFV